MNGVVMGIERGMKEIKAVQGEAGAGVQRDVVGMGIERDGEAGAGVQRGVIGMKIERVGGGGGAGAKVRRRGENVGGEKMLRRRSLITRG